MNSTNSEFNDHLDYITYGIVFPAILTIGLFGAIANLIIIHVNSLTAYHYGYIKGMTICDLLVVITTVPFAYQMSKQIVEWDSKFVAWYNAHLELYVINTFCGTGVLLTVSTTTERYLGFCHPFKARNLRIRHPNHARLVIFLAPIITAVLYLPYVLRSTVQIDTCFNNSTNETYVSYIVAEDKHITNTLEYTIFNYLKEIVFRILPAIALALMNALIIHNYRKARRFLRRKRSMQIRVTVDEVCQLNRDRRLIVTLVGLTLQFIICTTPAAVLAMTLDYSGNVDSELYEIFRSIANILEMTKNCSSLFVYCLCSAEYRQSVKLCFNKCMLSKKTKISHIHDNKLPD